MKIKRLLTPLLIISFIFLSACLMPSGSESTVSLSTVEPYLAPSAGEYDSKDTAIVSSVSTINKTVTFYSYELDQYYTLSYDSATRFADKYDVAVQATSLKFGSIVDILFLKEKKLLVSLRESTEAFSISEVSEFTVNVATRVFQHKSDNYELAKNASVYGGGDDFSLKDLNYVDSVTICGFDTTIYSIRVDKGHGYLKLEGEDKFVNGFLEIGSKQIEKITSPMLVTLREGEYKVKVSKNSTESTKTVIIKANEETVFDLSDIKMAEDEKGKVLFDVTPQEATLFVDGKEVDYSGLLEFTRGIHQLYAIADGYESITRYFNVASDSATLKVNLEALEKENDKAEEEKPKTDGYFIYINNPSDVEVYLDNYYIGISPTCFAKTSGTHVITLRKTGFETRSFNIMVEDASGDVTYSFDGLEPSSPVSGN